MARNGTFDQAAFARYGLLVAVGLFATGVLGETALPVLFGALPAWEHALFVDFEALGIVLALVSVFGFGIVWPLVE